MFGGLQEVFEVLEVQGHYAEWGMRPQLELECQGPVRRGVVYRGSATINLSDFALLLPAF